MQRMPRSLPGPVFLLLFVAAGPALAMDPSATEETNCLIACDANQENCRATHGTSGGPAGNAVRQTLMSRSLRKGAYFSQANRSVAPKERPRQ